MVRIGKLLLGQEPVIALTVTDLDSPKFLQKTKHQGVKVLEIRIDRFKNLNENHLLKKIHLFRKLGLPLIATIRSRGEGGGRFLSDSKRAELFKKILPWVQAIDLELRSKELQKSLIPLARQQKKAVILSYHHFQATPRTSHLLKLIRQGKRKGADIVKLAVTPKTKNDLARFLLLGHRSRNQNLIMIAMGPLGIPSRVLAPLFGSLLTYSFIGRSMAPGQIPLPRLLRERQLFFKLKK